MFRLLRLLVTLVCQCFRSRTDLLLENLALRQQLSVFKRRKQRPKMAAFDKLFWVGLNRIWSKWKNCLVIVTPQTVVRWHREGFRMHWRWRSRHEIGSGRRPISRELRELIFHMVAENPTWHSR
jgi:putative transposase